MGRLQRMRAQANLLLGMVRGALQGQVWRSMFAWVAEPRRRWREDARARVGLDGPHRPLEQTPAICSSLCAGHPKRNLCREKTIKVWQCGTSCRSIGRPNWGDGDGPCWTNPGQKNRDKVRPCVSTGAGHHHHPPALGTAQFCLTIPVREPQPARVRTSPPPVSDVGPPLGA